MPPSYIELHGYFLHSWIPHEHTLQSIRKLRLIELALVSRIFLHKKRR